MEKLQMPFNATKMNELDLYDLADKINYGDQEVLLEIRDKNNQIVGFQSIISLEERIIIAKKKLNYLAYLNRKYEKKRNRKYSYEIQEKISECKNEIKEILNLKSLLITTPEDLSTEIGNLESYNEDEILYSGSDHIKYENTKTYR